LFDLGKGKRRKSGRFLQHEDHHYDHDDDHNDDHDKHRQYPASAYPQILATPTAVPAGVVCASVPRKLCKAQKFATAAE